MMRLGKGGSLVRSKWFEVEGFILLNLYTMMLKISINIFYLMQFNDALEAT